ncbi:MAG: Sulfoxide reductase heme-binding subunit YedZ [Phycisphaerae bacterium]|nr:Sulfoxide reductase heme-binding subunit YedZ [Phycisphaerae bacterium]
MSVGYVAIQWNRHKRVYDACIAGGVVLYLSVFMLAGKAFYRGAHAISDPILAMRALATCAFLMLHVVLCLGPLARLDRRFLPWLYNRRHLGVATFLVGFAHAFLAIGFYHGFGVIPPLVSLLSSNTNYTSLASFPFEILGALALGILFLMAATSHDFWLRNLGARAWKRLHMLVYVAYGLLVMHVALGILQAQRSWWPAALVGIGVATVVGLHLVAGMRERRHDEAGTRRVTPDGENWVAVACVDDLAEARGCTVTVGGGERIALFRHDGGISATTNVCAHQGGPLGEGKIIDGCVTCPWHGWQYRPRDGQSPPPFTERIETYRVRVLDGRIEVDPRPLPPGTPVEPARIADRAG